MSEIGSFIELQLENGKEYYKNAARLNTCRAAIWHAARCYEVEKVYLPRYECNTVRDFLKEKEVNIEYYDIDENFLPKLKSNDKESAIVLANYYGIFAKKHFEDIIGNYNNVIIDNAQAFFSKPLKGSLNCYSARKFCGVPDGAYVVGDIAEKYCDYEQDYSSDTASFLLMRHEYGCEGKAYAARKLNEKRINESDCLKMSPLTQKILDSLDYENNKKRRKENFSIARTYFDGINEIDIGRYVDDETYPMVYPLLIEKDGIIERFHENKIFQGHWWEYLVDEAPKDSFEYRLSRYIVPITIDGRYGEEDIARQYKIVKEFI